jgi:hypothetical protein
MQTLDLDGVKETMCRHGTGLTAYSDKYSDTTTAFKHDAHQQSSLNFSRFAFVMSV